MYDILQPSFSQWLFDQLARWINYFDEEDRGDKHDPTATDDKDDGSDDKANDKDALPDPDKDPDKDSEDKGKKADPDKDDKDDKSGDDGTDKGGDDKGDHMIPKSRYDNQRNQTKEANLRNVELQNEIDELKGAQKKDPDAPTYEDQLSDLDRKIEEARADNNVDEVVRLGQEQRAIERTMYEEIANTSSTAAGKQAREQIKFDETVDALESTHSFLNEDSDDFDQDRVDEILDVQEGLVRTGRYTPAQAMTKAARLIIGEVEDAGGKPDPKKTDVAKNLDTANRIPPDQGDKGENSDKAGDLEGDATQLQNMTQEEFDAIPEETKRRLRGDAF